MGTQWAGNETPADTYHRGAPQVDDRGNEALAQHTTASLAAIQESKLALENQTATLAALRKAFEIGELPKDMRSARIVLLPKPGKPRDRGDSYRPMSPLNANVKLLAEALAIRLKKAMMTLVHPDQTGFIPGRSTALNLQQLHNNLASINSTKERAILFMDANKAFNSVELRYKFETLEKTGFGLKFQR
ncbi:hypothetical protein NDU88_003193 [Pleurodeles waltl]|uniref:Reverse transcriptase domain-containing protein n=1 Tax=Pleurodeles waltl TaxID=8319 RepID=A0AAV7LG38_PLEWA|nr:hypothetical protein NDU88_003193 [Pleurodeles waltl]